MGSMLFCHTYVSVILTREYRTLCNKRNAVRVNRINLLNTMLVYSRWSVCIRFWTWMIICWPSKATIDGPGNRPFTVITIREPTPSAVMVFRMVSIGSGDDPSTSSKRYSLAKQERDLVMSSRLIDAQWWDNTHKFYHSLDRGLARFGSELYDSIYKERGPHVII